MHNKWWELRVSFCRKDEPAYFYKMGLLLSAGIIQFQIWI